MQELLAREAEAAHARAREAEAAKQAGACLSIAAPPPPAVLDAVGSARTAIARWTPAAADVAVRRSACSTPVGTRSRATRHANTAHGRARAHARKSRTHAHSRLYTPHARATSRMHTHTPHTPHTHVYINAAEARAGAVQAQTAALQEELALAQEQQGSVLRALAQQKEEQVGARNRQRNCHVTVVT
jgi:hypothetical protein